MKLKSVKSLVFDTILIYNVTKENISKRDIKCDSYGGDKMAYIKKKKITFPKANNQHLGLVDIGGVGEIVYKVVKFKDYDYDDQANIVDKGIKGKIIYPLDPYEAPNLDTDLGLTGKKLIVSLCNLAEEINFKEYHNDVEVASLVMNWCKEYFHPYNIESLYEKYRELERGENDRKYYQEWTDGVFNLNTFIDDLAQLYSVFTYIYAFLECLNGNPEFALNYDKSGHYFHTVPWFADYMARIDVEKYDIDPSWDDITRAIKDSEHSKMHLNTKEEFRKAVVADKANIYKKIENMIPEIKIRLNYDIDRKKCELVANVESIFDICYYSIARLLAANAPSEDPNTDKYSVYDLGESVSFCEVCGRMYIKSGNNQKCCGDEACIRTINRKRQARHRQKLKENK